MRATLLGQMSEDGREREGRGKHKFIGEARGGRGGRQEGMRRKEEGGA
jgi:hypothetical protein